MATKKRPAPKKAPPKPKAKKPTPPKKPSSAPIERAERVSAPHSVRKGRSTACKILPYVLIFFALILTISLFIVRIIGIALIAFGAWMGFTTVRSEN